MAKSTNVIEILKSMNLVLFLIECTPTHVINVCCSKEETTGERLWKDLACGGGGVMTAGKG